MRHELISLTLAILLPQFPVVLHPGMTHQGTVIDLPHLWRNSDAVALLRIHQSESPIVKQVSEAEKAVCVQHRAKVLESFKRFIGEPQGQFELLEPRPAIRSEYNHAVPAAACLPGEECVAFLHWNGFEQRFQAFMLLPVRGGQITSGSVLELRSGMKIAALLTTLRSFQE